MSRGRRALVATVIVVGAVGVANAGGNPAAGRLKFETCRGCHSVEGYRHAYPDYAVPMLGGQYAGYLIAALKAYRDGKRRNATMQAQASSLSPQDIRDIAAYLTAQGKR